MSPEEAFNRFANSDSSNEVFEAALPELDKQVRVYLLYYLHFYSRADPESLDELAQEAVVRVFFGRARLAGKGVPTLKAILRTLCFRLVIDAYRDRRRSKTGRARKEPGSEDRPAVPTRPSQPEHNPGNVPAGEADDDLAEVLEHCIETLAKLDRIVFEYWNQMDLRPREMAPLFGRTTRWCQQILARARKALLDCIRSQGYDISD